MKRVVIFIFVAMMWATVWPQNMVVSGTVSEAANGQPIAGASVTSGKWSVVTNDDGFFTLKTDGDVAEVTISHLGFQSQRVKVGAASQKALRIRLKPAYIELHEVLVMNDNAREIVGRALARIPHNYSQQPELMKCFYRETAMKRQHYICVAEGVVDMYKTGYQHGPERDRVAISKGRRLVSPRQGDTLSVKVLGGPVTPVILDIVKNRDFLLNWDELDFYDMRLEVPTSINGRMQYVVALSPRAVKHGNQIRLPELMHAPLYYGHLYIDQETLAFTHAELTLDMSDRAKATEMMLVKKPAGVRFRPKELSMLVDYKTGADGMTRISYLRTTFRFNCDWRRRLFATSFAAVCEMVVTSLDEIAGTKATPISGRESFDQRDAFFDKVDYFRDPTFWNDYNIIEPTESLDRAVHRLLKKF